MRTNHQVRLRSASFLYFGWFGLVVWMWPWLLQESGVQSPSRQSKLPIKGPDISPFTFWADVNRGVPFVDVKNINIGSPVFSSFHADLFVPIRPILFSQNQVGGAKIRLRFTPASTIQPLQSDACWTLRHLFFPIFFWGGVGCPL